MLDILTNLQKTSGREKILDSFLYKFDFSGIHVNYEGLKSFGIDALQTDFPLICLSDIVGEHGRKVVGHRT